MKKPFKKLKFDTGSQSYTSIYAYVVEIECNDYNANHYKIMVFPSYDEALKFIKETFFNKDEEPEVTRDSDSSWIIYPSEHKDEFLIPDRVSENQVDSYYYDVRLIRLYVDTRNFFMREDGMIAQLGDFNYPDSTVEYDWKEKNESKEKKFCCFSKLSKRNIS